MAKVFLEISMTDPTIICPSCATEIKLTESLAKPLVEASRQELKLKVEEYEAEVAKRESILKKKEKDIYAAQKNIETEVSSRIKLERAKIADFETRKAEQKVANDIKEKTKEVTDLGEVIKVKEKKLIEAQKGQVDFLKQKRAFDDARREMDLTIEKRVQGSIEEVRKQVKEEIQEELGHKINQKEEQMAQMTRQIEQLKQKAEQGSQQLKGEAFELQLEQVLRSKFVFDHIEGVPKGDFGGDLVQRVVSQMGKFSGTILWELKHTKSWNDGWLSKLRGDQRVAKAEISILVSVTLPKEVETFDQINGVWISAPKFAIPLATALRQTLIEVYQSKQSRDGQHTKMELVYDYLVGPNFRHRITAIVEKIGDMQSDLDREKKAMTRLWSKRDAQIQSVIESTVGMYGDLQGIAGRALQEIEGLEIPLIEQDANLFDQEG